MIKMVILMETGCLARACGSSSLARRFGADEK